MALLEKLRELYVIYDRRVRDVSSSCGDATCSECGETVGAEIQSDLEAAFRLDFATRDALEKAAGALENLAEAGIVIDG